MPKSSAAQIFEMGCAIRLPVETDTCFFIIYVKYNSGLKEQIHSRN
jgi:hypothetical protein